MPALCADDLTLPLDDGNVVIRARFIRLNEYGTSVPELAFKLTDQTSSSWRTLKLEFDIGGLCSGEPRQWNLPVTTSLGWLEGHEVVKEYSDTIIPLVGKVDGCSTEIIKARIILAENLKTRIDGIAGERVDLASQLRELAERQRSEESAKAEQERIATEEQAKRAEAQGREQAAEAARRKRLAEEQKRKQAEADAQYAKVKSEGDAKKAEEVKRVRGNCKLIYDRTIDKKLTDLTVREEQQVRACQALGFYTP
jgi:hypothetical protein